MKCPGCDQLCESRGPIGYCPGCLAMIDGDQLLTEHEGYAYNFCPNGTFSLLGRVGRKLSPRPLRESVRSLLGRIQAHVLWLILWATLLHFFHRTIFAFLFFLSLGFIGCYTTILLLRGALRPYFFPPTWEAVSQKIQKGQLAEAQTFIEENNLSGHPGLACNLGLAYLKQGLKEKARDWLERAHNQCPDHPAIEAFVKNLSLD